MACSCQGGVEIMTVYRIENLPDSIETVVLEVNQNAPHVPSRNFKSTTSTLMYKVRDKDSVLEILANDLEKMLNIQVGGVPLFVLSNKAIEEYVVAETKEETVAKTVTTPLGDPVTPEPVVQVIKENDDFTVIDGVGKATNQKLHASGINYFDDLVNVTEDQIENLGIQQSWIDQALAIINEETTEE